MALIDIPELDAEQVVRKAMKIAGDICVYTNHNINVITVENAKPKSDSSASISSEDSSASSNVISSPTP